MTDRIITAVGDATLREGRPGLTDASGDWVRLDATTSARMRGLLLPELPNIAGRTVQAAFLYGHVGPGWLAQTLTGTPYTSRRSPGRSTWTNEPATDAARAAPPEVVGALPDGELIDLDLTNMLQDVADGAEWFGLQLKTSSTAANQRLYSSESGEPAWELHLTLSDAPEKPSNLRPNGGAVKDGEPILAWDFLDLGGASTDQGAFRVEIDTPAAGADPDEVAPDFSSGWVSSTEPEYDLSAATYAPPASPPGDTYWRVTTRDGAGIESEPSDWAAFSVAPLPTLVIDSPTGAFGDPSPELIAHLTGGTVDSWKAFAYGPNRSDVRAESGLTDGAISWQVPFVNRDDRRVLRSGSRHWLYLKVYDTVDRATAVGQKSFVDAWIPVDLVENPAITPTTNLTVTQVAEGDPRHTWQWQRTEAATAWIIEIDDEEVERLEPEDVDLSAGVYSWVDYGHISPLVPHKLRVRALDGSKQRSGGASLSNRTYAVEGVWLFPDNEEPIKMSGTVVGGWAREDRAATYVPLVGPELDIIYDRPLRSGSFEGTIDFLQDVWTTLDVIKRLRAGKIRKARLIWGSQSQRVRLRSPDATSADEINEVNLLHVARFGFVGLGD